MDINISIEGMSRDEAIIALVTEEGLTLKEAKVYYKENKPEPRPSFKKRFYAELEEGKMTDERFAELIEDEGGNVEAHKSAHKLVLDMANAIWGS